MEDASLSDIYVFLGPTLPLQEAQAILPARYLPPIKCGDLLKLARLKPKAVLIIDGVFEQSATVWHKEILFMLAQGIHIYGASSMGALRAAELDIYGMQGIGEIYKLYTSLAIQDDAEVAVALLPKPPYTAISEPLVNVRASINKATQESILSHEQAEQLFHKSDSTFYTEREYIDSRYRIDLKREDALLALNALRENLPTKPFKPNFTYPNTVYARTLLQRCNAEPFIGHYSWLPDSEKLALTARLLGDTYKNLKTLALLIDYYQYENKPKQNIQQWLLKYFPKPNEVQSNLLRKIAISEDCCFMNLKKLLILLGSAHSDTQSIQAFLETSVESHLNHKCLLLISIIWGQIREKIKDLEVAPTSDTLAYYSNKLRRLHGCLKQKTFLKWLKQHSLSDSDYIELTSMFFYFDYFILRNNISFLGNMNSPAVHNSIYKVLKICDGLEYVKSISDDSSLLDHLVQELKHPVDTTGYLQSLDFMNQYDFEQYIQILRNTKNPSESLG